jgi:hypothetical protein
MDEPSELAARTAFEPDALVYCGPRLPPDSIEIPEPLIVVEVPSEGTAARDHRVSLSPIRHGSLNAAPPGHRRDLCRASLRIVANERHRRAQRSEDREHD